MSKRLFDGKTYRLCLDQYGTPCWTKTLRGLREFAADKYGARSSPQKQYIERDGVAYHNGYVIGRYWFSVYIPMEVAQ